MAKRNRFKVIEYGSGYALLDTETGQENWLSDGVDTMFTPTGKSMSPGSEYFRRAWEKAINSMSEEEVEDLYFF